MIFALVIGTLLEDFRLQPDRIAADVAQRTDQWVSKPFAPAQGLSAAEFRAAPSPPPPSAAARRP